MNKSEAKQKSSEQKKDFKGNGKKIKFFFFIHQQRRRIACKQIRLSAASDANGEELKTPTSFIVRQ